MLTLAEPAAANQALGRWLRLLWGTAPPLHFGSDQPFISAGQIHLPPQPQWQQHRAAAAHAAAHLVYSPRQFSVDGLLPLHRALLGLLEDARVEALAMRELPGLARLWRPLHSASPADGASCEALMARLARALADPAYRDPHAWVAKGRHLFYLDEALALPALRSAAELRQAACALGHDLGQARLPFNPRGHRPSPAYRDDHRWMWPAELLQAQQARSQPSPAAPEAPEASERSATASQAADLPAPADTVVLHPEWDRLIQRLRPRWVQVQVAQPAGPAPGRPQPLASAAGTGGPRSPAHGPSGPDPALAHRLLSPLRAWCRPAANRGRAAQGDQFHLDALLSWQLDRRCGRPGDPRVYRARQGDAHARTVWLLLDHSASTADTLGDGVGPGHTVLHTAATAVHAVASALERLGLRCGVAAFHSRGRQAVRFQVLQPPDATRWPQQQRAARWQRLQALQPEGSTRLGAALRQASQAGGRSRRQAFWVWVFSDGQPHDVDVHDARYLVADARQAVLAARQRGQGMACFTVADRPAPQAQRIFGARAVVSLPRLDALPAALRQLLR